MTLIVLPVANEEFEAAKEWYDLQSAGLGKRYRELVKQTLAAILRNPLRYQSYSLGFHRAFVKVFPFKVYYKMDGDDIVVVAFAHNHRKPEYWLHR